MQEDFEWQVVVLYVVDEMLLAAAGQTRLGRDATLSPKLELDPSIPIYHLGLGLGVLISGDPFPVLIQGAKG